MTSVFLITFRPMFCISSEWIDQCKCKYVLYFYEVRFCSLNDVNRATHRFFCGYITNVIDWLAHDSNTNSTQFTNTINNSSKLVRLWMKHHSSHFDWSFFVSVPCLMLKMYHFESASMSKRIDAILDERKENRMRKWNNSVFISILSLCRINF